MERVTDRHMCGDTEKRLQICRFMFQPGSGKHVGNRGAHRRNPIMKALFSGRVFHAGDVPLHRLGLNSRQVVTHAHIENEGALRRRHVQIEKTLNEVQQNPRLGVLLPRFVQRQFGRPFGVVPLIVGVNTRFVQLQGVQNLHRLEFDKAATGEIGTQDIDRQLGVRSRGWAKRHFARLTKDVQRPRVVFPVPRVLRQVEYRRLRSVFFKETA